MRRFYIEQNSEIIKIEGEEHNHISSVLRLKVGDKIACFSNDEFDYVYEIVEIQKKFTICKLNEKKLNNSNPNFNLTVFQGLPKGDKLELIIQKLNELGAKNIIPFESEFCIAKFNSNKLERLNKIAIESSKQCGRSKSLVVENAVSFKNMLEKLKEYDTVLFAYENERTVKLKEIELKGNIAVVVGSEGGFSKNEVESLLNSNAQIISLGNRILRTETASIAISSYISLKLGD